MHFKIIISYNFFKGMLYEKYYQNVNFKYKAEFLISQNLSKVQYY